ncbi:hypothetical protein Tco_1120963 [Tanacetum coccineum]|uniref:Uncharacterized protein n=1 Tax=Tanacetum coccineum TaxID=301880 RepID=A0ABQ5IZA8_9ASTR
MEWKCDPVGTLMEIKDKLDLDQNGSPVDATKYRNMIGALMYLTSSRPDIVHAIVNIANYAEVKTPSEYFGGAQFLGKKLVSGVLKETRLYGAVKRKQNMCLYPLVVPKSFGCGHS